MPVFDRNFWTISLHSRLLFSDLIVVFIFEFFFDFHVFSVVGSARNLTLHRPHTYMVYDEHFYAMNTSCQRCKTKEQFPFESFNNSFQLYSLDCYAANIFICPKKSETFKKQKYLRIKQNGTNIKRFELIQTDRSTKKERQNISDIYLRRIAWFGLMSWTIKVICKTNHRLILQARITRFWCR